MDQAAKVSGEPTLTGAAQRMKVCYQKQDFNRKMAVSYVEG
jgi:hypothetical protein